MKVVLAPDAFKGTLTQFEATHCMKKAFHTVAPEITVIEKPMPDGGVGNSERGTISGKAPSFVAKLAKKHEKPCILVSGVIKDESILLDYFSKVYSLVDEHHTLEEAHNQPMKTLTNRMKRIIKETIIMKKVYHTDKAPAAIGPYSQAVEAGDFVYVSGQIGVDPETRELADGIEAQANQMFENAKVILDEAGLTFNNAVKCTVYLASMDDFTTVNEIYASYFDEPYPARVAIEVSRLPNNALVEMDIIAYRK